MLVGFHVEGWDFLILRAFLAKLLGLAEDQIEPDQVTGSGRGLHFVVEMVPKVLHRFYGKCARVAVIGVDNDGNLDLMSTSAHEDPRRPRHWVHLGNEAVTAEGCRWCQLFAAVEAWRPGLNWVPRKPGGHWPVLIVVPVEMIEAWLIITQALLVPGQGSLYAENEARAPQKQRFYGKPEPTRDDVEGKALPLIRQMTPEHLRVLRDHARSFDQFAAQVEHYHDDILAGGECW